jgi:hypothetical protein
MALDIDGLWLSESPRPGGRLKPLTFDGRMPSIAFFPITSVYSKTISAKITATKVGVGMALEIDGIWLSESPKARLKPLTFDGLRLNAVHSVFPDHVRVFENNQCENNGNEGG